MLTWGKDENSNLASRLYNFSWYSTQLSMKFIMINTASESLKARKVSISDLDPNRLTSDSVPERFFLKKLILKKRSADDNKSMKNLDN